MSTKSLSITNTDEKDFLKQPVTAWPRCLECRWTWTLLMLLSLSLWQSLSGVPLRYLT